MRVAIALLVSLLLPATASASTIHTDAGHVYFDGGANDLVNMQVNAGFDNEFASSAIFFLPLTGHVNPTTADANCRAGSGSFKCASATDKEVDVTTGSQNDFVRVLAANSLLVLHAGAGNDRAFVDNGTRITAFGEAGNDDLAGSTSFDTLDGGPGDDLLSPRGFGDIVNGGADFDTVQMPAGGVTVTLDDVANDGKPGENENIHSDVEKVAGGSGDDQLDGSGGPDTLDGADGNDKLNGLDGSDTLMGGGGNDVIQARDGATDNVLCGTGDDRAVVDPGDHVAADCETVEYADSDKDGVDARTDCNDANPAIHPGATDVPGNGVDEDCSGADAPVANTNPGGNGGTTTNTGLTTNPGSTSAPAPVPYHLRHRWDLASKWSRVIELRIDRLPAGAKLTVSCKGGGCPFKSRAASGGNLAKLFKRRKLSKGAVVDIKIEAPGYKSVTVRFTVKGKKKLPQQRELPA